MTVRMALVGAGAMADYHVKKFTAIPGVSIQACADHRSAKAEAFAARYGIPYRFDRIDTLLDAVAGDSPFSEKFRIDAASCAVVDSHHPRIALACLNRGLPLFCEKPMSRSLVEAESMAEAAASAAADGAGRASGNLALPVVVNFSKRNAPALVALAAVVREGRLGRILNIDASYRQGWLVTGAWGDWRSSTTRRWRLSPAESTAGVLGDLGSHLFDAILAVTGRAIIDPILVDP
ncbi:MAG: Gfo/Idh/MocA family oxidoreductase, partial [Rectinemataceae bacterium]|nr:Gfo/Idh/MocA family oxidoreductase [Rectinemataceae bacterium]